MAPKALACYWTHSTFTGEFPKVNARQPNVKDWFCLHSLFTSVKFQLKLMNVKFFCSSLPLYNTRFFMELPRHYHPHHNHNQSQQANPNHANAWNPSVIPSPPSQVTDLPNTPSTWHVPDPLTIHRSPTNTCPGPRTPTITCPRAIHDQPLQHHHMFQNHPPPTAPPPSHVTEPTTASPPALSIESARRRGIDPRDNNTNSLLYREFYFVSANSANKAT